MARIHDSTPQFRARIGVEFAPSRRTVAARLARAGLDPDAVRTALAARDEAGGLGGPSTRPAEQAVFRRRARLGWFTPTEEDVLGTTLAECDPAFARFLARMGTFWRLDDPALPFAARLDTSSRAEDGPLTLLHTSRTGLCVAAFHVAPLMPSARGPDPALRVGWSSGASPVQRSEEEGSGAFAESLAMHMGAPVPTLVTRKKAHVGNDYVNVVYLEDDSVDLPFGWLTGQFNAVQIRVCPLSPALVRVQVLQRRDIPHFGPLTGTCILPTGVAPHLVRATAIAADAVCRDRHAQFGGGALPWAKRGERIRAIVSQHAATESTAQ